MTSFTYAEPALCPIPLELLVEIASHLPRADLARLGRVNTFFRAALLQHLYAEVIDVAAFHSRSGMKHHRPPLEKYAKHVRCLEVRAKPFACCEGPEHPLPALQVLRLEYAGLDIDTADEVPRFCSSDAYEPDTVVVCSPSTMRKDAEPAKAIAEKLEGAKLVLHLRERPELLLGALLGAYTPRSRSEATIVLNFLAEPKETVDALLETCRCLANLDQAPLDNHQLRRVCFVVGGVEFSDTAREELAKGLSKQMVKHRTVAALPDAVSIPDTNMDATSAHAVDDSAIVVEEVLPPPDIEILHLEEYLRDKRSRHVLSRTDIMKHYAMLRPNGTVQHNDMLWLLAAHEEMTPATRLLEPTQYSMRRNWPTVDPYDLYEASLEQTGGDWGWDGSSPEYGGWESPYSYTAGWEDPGIPVSDDGYDGYGGYAGNDNAQQTARHPDHEEEDIVDTEEERERLEEARRCARPPRSPGSKMPWDSDNEGSLLWDDYDHYVRWACGEDSDKGHGDDDIDGEQVVYKGQGGNERDENVSPEDRVHTIGIYTHEMRDGNKQDYPTRWDDDSGYRGDSVVDDEEQYADDEDDNRDDEDNDIEQGGPLAEQENVVGEQAYECEGDSGEDEDDEEEEVGGIDGDDDGIGDEDDYDEDEDDLIGLEDGSEDQENQYAPHGDQVENCSEWETDYTDQNDHTDQGSAYNEREDEQTDEEDDCTGQDGYADRSDGGLEQDGTYSEREEDCTDEEGDRADLEGVYDEQEEVYSDQYGADEGQEDEEEQEGPYEGEEGYDEDDREGDRAYDSEGYDDGVSAGEGGYESAGHDDGGDASGGGYDDGGCDDGGYDDGPIDDGGYDDGGYDDGGYDDGGYDAYDDGYDDGY